MEEGGKSMAGAEGIDRSEPQARRCPRTSRWPLMVVATLCLCGIALSVELTRIHLFVHTDPSYHSVCALSEGINCETVAFSRYSVFAGLPVSLWGIIGYVAMGLLALLALRREDRTWPQGALLVLIAFSAATSAVLAFISATRIDSICLFCTASYVVNFVLLLMGYFIVRKLERGVADILASSFKEQMAQPTVALWVTIPGAFCVGILLSCVPPYWEVAGWSDVPTLPQGTDEEGYHWIGAQEPEVEIVEFSDYECPHCRAAHKEIRTLAARYPDDVKLVHRHYPLDVACNPQIRRPFHEHACRFAEAAECGARQGRFWEMNDALFSIQKERRAPDVDPVKIAVGLGLDRSAFVSCLEDHLASKTIAGDVQEAISRKLRGTPTFFINGEPILGRVSEDMLANILDQSRPRHVGLGEDRAQAEKITN